MDRDSGCKREPRRQRARQGARVGVGGNRLAVCRVDALRSVDHVAEQQDRDAPGFRRLRVRVRQFFGSSGRRRGDLQPGMHRHRARQATPTNDVKDQDRKRTVTKAPDMRNDSLFVCEHEFLHRRLILAC